MMGEGWVDPANSGSGLCEITLAEDVAFDQVEQIGVYFGADRFHEIERQRGPHAVVYVESW